MNLIRTLQGVARWYFTGAGLVFNLLAMISLIGLVVGNDEFRLFPAGNGILDPLQNVPTCTRALTGTRINFETETAFPALDGSGRKRDMILIGQRAFVSGMTKEGHRVIQAQARAQKDDSEGALHLAFEVNAEGEILRCLPSPLSAQARMTECLAAAGTYDSSGTCLLPIQLPSDCDVMGGQHEGVHMCRVPREGRILSSTLKVSETK